jgi:hypothetical protein
MSIEWSSIPAILERLTRNNQLLVREADHRRDTTVLSVERIAENVAWSKRGIGLCDGASEVVPERAALRGPQVKQGPLKQTWPIAALGTRRGPLRWPIRSSTTICFTGIGARQHTTPCCASMCPTVHCFPLRRAGGSQVSGHIVMDNSLCARHSRRERVVRRASTLDPSLHAETCVVAQPRSSAGFSMPHVLSRGSFTSTDDLPAKIDS